MFTDGPLGYFGKTLIKAMKAAGVGYAAVEKMTNGVISDSNVRRYCKGTIPEMRFMRMLADIFKLDFFQLQQYAARDYLDRIATRCEIKVADIPGCTKVPHLLPIQECEEHTLPIYDSETLVRCLSREGYPLRKTKIRLKSADFGPHAYALYMRHQLLDEFVNVRQYIVIAPERKLSSETDFGIAGYVSGSSRNMKIAIGGLYIKDSHVSVATLKPKFKTTWIDRKDLLFVYGTASIILHDDLYIVRGP